jgi:hypothetical protein
VGQTSNAQTKQKIDLTPSLTILHGWLGQSTMQGVGTLTKGIIENQNLERNESPRDSFWACLQ